MSFFSWNTKNYNIVNTFFHIWRFFHSSRKNWRHITWLFFFSELNHKTTKTKGKGIWEPSKQHRPWINHPEARTNICFLDHQRKDSPTTKRITFLVSQKYITSPYSQIKSNHSSFGGLENDTIDKTSLCRVELSPFYYDEKENKWMDKKK